MKLTRFFQLKETIRQLDANEGIDGLAFRLKQEPFRIDPAELVFGRAGIYLITTDGAVCKVMLYDAEQSIDTEDMDPLLRQDALSGGFDSDKLVEKLPRYHFLNCQTVQSHSQQRWQDDTAWQISQSPSARFSFRYVTRTGILCDMNTQRLLPCEYCVSEMAELGVIKNAQSGALLPPLSDDSFYTRQRSATPPDCTAIPKNLWTDWSVISNHYRKLTGSVCQGKSCAVTRTAPSELPRCLETHYTSRDQSQRHFHFIESLCSLCHSQREGHIRMQRRADVVELSAVIKSVEHLSNPQNNECTSLP